jgi:hypothetical protein
MEETLRDAPPADTWREGLAQTIEDQRRRIGQRIAGQRERLRELEARIASQLGDATQELTRQQDQARQAATDGETQTAALLAELKLQERSLAARQDETQRQRRQIAQQLRAKKNDLAAEAELHRAEAAAAGSGDDLQLQLKLSELQGKYEQLKEALEAREALRDETTQRLAELKTQNDSRQQELRQQHAALELAQRKAAELEAERGRLQSELQRHLDEGRQAQAARAELERVRKESEEQIERMRADQGKSQDVQVQSLHQQLDELRKKLAGEETAWQQARQGLEKELAEAKQANNAKQAGSQADATELAKLRDENKQLEAWLAEAEEKAKQTGDGGGQEMDDMRRRFEMAVQDVRELKTKNAELAEQLSKARQGGAGVPAAGAHGSDWESLKQKLLADLETDFDENDESQKADKLSVQGAIKITDEVVAEKEREVEELKRMLDSQAQQVGEVAVGAAAVAGMLDADELIRQERESLKQLQTSLREQLGRAEIDISLERAKLARERAELDEKIRGLEADRASMPTGSGEAGDKNKKPGGRKWLARLGLGEGKEE